MLTISFSKIVEESLAKEGKKHLAGNIQKPESLFTAEAMERLTKSHPGVFSFLAFNPKGDKTIVEYLSDDTLADDSGDVMCLFTMKSDTGSKLETTTASDIVSIDTSRTPSSLILERLYAPSQAPIQPGILFFRHFEQERPIYVGLDASLLEVEHLRRRLRELFSVAASINHRDGGRTDKAFSASFGNELQRRKIAYDSPGQRSMREWLTWSSQALWEYREDIVTVAKLAL